MENNNKILQNNTSNNWINEELSSSEFKDKRLSKRFISLMKNLWQNIGEPIPLACQDWANTKSLSYHYY